MKVVLGQNIRKIRKHWKLGQGDFGAIFDTTRPTLSSYENNNSKPDIFFLVKLQQLSHINAYDLVYNDILENNISPAPDHDNLTIPPGQIEEQDLMKVMVKQMMEMQETNKKVRELEELIKQLKDGGSSIIE